jgi:hypothetical protein
VTRRDRAAMDEKWWQRTTRVRSKDEPRRVGSIVHALPSGAALVAWDGLRERFYVGLHRLSPADGASHERGER